MKKGRKAQGAEAPRPNEGWEYTTEVQINGRNVTAGTELKITGERGRYRFIRSVKTDKGVEWVDVWGGPKGSEQWRSFKPEKVKRVHYKNQTIGNLAAEYKQKQLDKKAELEQPDE